MATKIKYESFRAAFDEEAKRYSELQSSARVLLGVCTFFLGGIGLRASELPNAFTPAMWSTLLAAIAFGVAFFWIVRSIEMLRYKPICDPVEIVDALSDEEDEPSDEDFLDARIGDIVNAMPLNTESNDTRAERLDRASRFILAGITFAILGLAVEAGSDRASDESGVDHGSAQQQIGRQDR